MANPLFSTYAQGENRVTSTLMAVLENINNQLTEDLLEAVLDESDLALVTFDNQLVGDGSVPDAGIRSSASLLFETKTRPNEVDVGQLREHLSYLDDEDADTERLVVLTPDHEEPPALGDIDDRVVWANFDNVVNAVESILARDPGSTEQSFAVPTEREAFLLRELVRFLYEDAGGQLVSGEEDRVLVVGARKAWPEFEAHGLYFCQPNRSFKPSRYLAFYTDGEIKPIVPKITDSIETVELTREGVENATSVTEVQREALRNAVDGLEAADADRYGSDQKVIFLDEDSEIKLDGPVSNDKTAEGSDRTVAFVQGHRYVSASALRESPLTTSALEDS
ncbi:hypothetical protein [Halovivax gelatinilyticus]|uniref:hypothetical protein n=1 Tax=Halovivax gelatinilyticus TaxID=2961597 RepID=UPI0020CA4E14|nr:hypothetical protein [Halovivax gelatinilyticus]